MEKRIKIAVLIVIFIFGIFTFRLWYLQVLKGYDFKEIDKRNRLRVINIPAPRGIIYDRNNKPLVKNVPSFDIVVVKEDLPRDPEILKDMAGLLGLKLDDMLSTIARSSTKPFKPMVLKQDVTFEEVARVEARKIDFPGLQISVIGGREYIYRHSASHVIGYLGSPRTEQLRTFEYRDVPREAFIGQLGSEKIHDSELRGIAGKRIIEVDALGSIIKVVRILRPVKGQDIKLTVDINLQMVAEESLRGKAGAVVAMKVDTGEILTLASAPTFDPNLFVRGIDAKDWKRLVNDPAKPLLNRAIQSQYPPGSTFKIVTAIAALEEGIVDKDTNYYCKGSIYYGRTFRCWKQGGHGDVNLYKAIVESCDVYFYEIGKKLDVDILAQYAFGFGLGRPTGIELEGEAAGIVPTSGWKLETKGEQWYTGETLNTVIGQGYLSATPIQMAALMATVVNGGKLYQPRVLMEREPRTRAEKMTEIAPDHIALVKEALLGVVSDEHGTGKLAGSDIVSIGGKTGTTQVIGSVADTEKLPDKYKDHAWFVSFAPEINPELAVAVFVEHGGHGSTGAAPIARKIIEAYFKSNGEPENKDG